MSVSKPRFLIHCFRCGWGDATLADCANKGSAAVDEGDPIRFRDHSPIRVSEHLEKEGLEHLASEVGQRSGYIRD